MIQNATIEERVALLEIQLEEMEEDVTGLRIDHTQLEGDVNFLFDEQVIQDERLLNLEQETEEIDEQLVGFDDDLESEFIELISVYFLGNHYLTKSRYMLSIFI